MNRNNFSTPTTEVTVSAMVGGWDKAGDSVLAAIAVLRDRIEAASRPACPDEVVDDVDLMQELVRLHARMEARAELWRSKVKLGLVETPAKVVRDEPSRPGSPVTRPYGSPGALGPQRMGP